MRKITIVFGAAFLLLCFACRSPAAYVPGWPSIDCNSVRNTVALILCGGPDQARADWEVNSASWALYFSIDDSGRQLLEADQQAWRHSLDQICALPRQLTPADQAGQAIVQAIGRRMFGPGMRIPNPPQVTQAHVNCILNAYHARATLLRSKLTGDALDESWLSPEQHVEIQDGLAKKGFFQSQQIGAGTIDGEFGRITRIAIKQFQQSLGAVPSGFLSNEQRSTLLERPADRQVAQQQPVPRQLTPHTPYNSPQQSVVVQTSPYVVDGLALGGFVVFDSPAYREYQCSPSDQFPHFTMCRKHVQEKQRSGTVLLANTILHNQDGAAVYINRYIEPANFERGELEREIDKLSIRYGERARVINMPSVPGLDRTAVIARWGKIELEPLESDSLAILASGNSVTQGLLVDYLGDFTKSAKLRLPVYRLAGGAGYVWIASTDQKGRGTLRILTSNPSNYRPNVAAPRITPDLAQVGSPPPSVAAQDPIAPLPPPSFRNKKRVE
jgi:uncharacterized protein YecT (DUF1311 family)